MATALYAKKPVLAANRRATRDGSPSTRMEEEGAHVPACGPDGRRRSSRRVVVNFARNLANGRPKFWQFAAANSSRNLAGATDFANPPMTKAPPWWCVRGGCRLTGLAHCHVGPSHPTCRRLHLFPTARGYAPRQPPGAAARTRPPWRCAGRPPGPARPRGRGLPGGQRRSGGRRFPDLETGVAPRPWAGRA